MDSIKERATTSTQTQSRENHSEHQRAKQINNYSKSNTEDTVPIEIIREKHFTNSHLAVNNKNIIPKEQGTHRICQYKIIYHYFRTAGKNIIIIQYLLGIHIN